MATRNIVPQAAGEGGLGTADKPWGKVYASEIESPAIRVRLTEDTAYYMDTEAGSDLNDGTTADKALQSFAGLSALLNNIDNNGYNVTVYMAAGTYANCKLKMEQTKNLTLRFEGPAFNADNLNYGANLTDVSFYGVTATFKNVGFVTTSRVYFYWSHILFCGDIRIGSALQFSTFSTADFDPANGSGNAIAVFHVIKTPLEWIVGVNTYSNFSGMSATSPFGLVFHQNTYLQSGLFYISNSTIYTSNWVLPAPGYAITGNNFFVNIQFAGLFHGTVVTQEAFLANWPNKKANFQECTPGAAIVRFSNAVQPYKLGPALQTVDNTTPGFYVRAIGNEGQSMGAPAGGTWVVRVTYRRVADGAIVHTPLGGVVAGGTTWTPESGYAYDLECWKIA